MATLAKRRYYADLTLAVKDGPETVAKFRPAGWDSEPADEAEYRAEWSYLAREFNDRSLLRGSVMRFSTTVTEGTAAARRLMDEWVPSYLHSLAEAAEECQNNSISISPMDWNVGGVTYVVDAQLNVSTDGNYRRKRGGSARSNRHHPNPAVARRARGR